MRIPPQVLVDVAVAHPLRDHDQVWAMHICANQGESVGI